MLLSRIWFGEIIFFYEYTNFNLNVILKIWSENYSFNIKKWFKNTPTIKKKNNFKFVYGKYLKSNVILHANNSCMLFYKYLVFNDYTAQLKPESQTLITLRIYFS